MAFGLKSRTKVVRGSEDEGDEAGSVA